MRRMYHFRSQLMPYIYSNVWHTHNTMVPLNRSMFIDFGSQKESFDQPQQFMFGDVLMAAPITSPGAGENKVASQKVWFPKGEVWYDYFTGERFDGGQTQDISKPLDEFPLYVRGGHILAMQPYTSRPATTPLTKLELTAYPAGDDADNTFELYEDDGISLDYTKGKYSVTKLNYSQKGNKVTITVNPAEGAYDGCIEKRSYKVCIPKADVKAGVKVNGKKRRVSVDKSGIPVIEIPETDVRKKVMVEYSI